MLSCRTPPPTTTPLDLLLLNQAGSTDTFTVALTAQPTNDVVISVTSGDTSEATLDKSSLTFTNGNWNSAQTVTVTGVNDDLDDGNGLIDAIGDLPPAAIAAAALVAAVAAAAAAASLAGPSLLSWLFRGAIGIWFFGLLFGRRGVRCDVCALLLVKRDGVWVDKDTHWQVGIN